MSEYNLINSIKRSLVRLFAMSASAASHVTEVLELRRVFVVQGSKLIKKGGCFGHTKRKKERSSRPIIHLSMQR